MNSKKRIAGNVVKIDLGEGVHSYARVLEKDLFAFYDCLTSDDLSIAHIVSLPILFKVAVMKYAVTKGHWEVVGHLPLETPLRNAPLQFMQDRLQPEQFSIYENGKTRRATREECLGLERVAVWDPVHVEDRLRDHYAGRPNKWVESLKIR
jgi:hypothetical protein